MSTFWICESVLYRVINNTGINIDFGFDSREWLYESIQDAGLVNEFVSPLPRAWKRSLIFEPIL